MLLLAPYDRSAATSLQMLHKFSAWTRPPNFDQQSIKIGRRARTTRGYGEKSQKHVKAG